ncbi:MAG: hypothetical protein HYU28_09265 [Actinobacteria bacterium]|nr:hypothetical protein [Actinomycetota bacterium]
MNGANAARWDGESRGHYEAWYLTLSDRASGRGFWFRYTLEAPKDRRREPVAELWGFAFAPGQPARGGKRTNPVEWPPRGVMQVGEAVLEEGHAVGQLPDLGLSWDLRWDPPATALWHIPGRLGRSRIPSTRVASPSLDVRFSGEVRIDGEAIPLAGAPGCQTHLWGRQHAARWQWGHCNGFQADGSVVAGVVVEAVSAVPLLAPGRAAPRGLPFLYAEVAGEPFACNAFPWFLRASSRVHGHRWELRGRCPVGQVRAVFEAVPAEMAQVIYEDPDGAHAWCANSEIARCALEIERGSGAIERFTSEGLAHVEFGTRTPDPDVPVLC